MEADNEHFFENLAKGNHEEKASESAAPKMIHTEMDEETVTEPVASEETGNFEVELAKASSAIAAPSRKHTPAKPAHGESAWDTEPEGELAVDIYQTPHEIVIESAIAGVKADDITVNVTTDSLSIKGVRYHDAPVGENDYLYQECYWGRFARTIILPQEINPEHASVSFKNGILKIYLPKSGKKKSARLRVRVD